MSNQPVLPLSMDSSLAALLLPPPEATLQLVPYSPLKKKKRTKLFRVDSAPPPRPRRPDPHAPKITRPCTECGKKFWSWKALFGHMRCHPERQWRGINPPPNLRRPETAAATPEDLEVAECLLMLANALVNPVSPVCEDFSASGLGFECSSCKKVFGSHQALGGHRASHKNVKGCFAINNRGEAADGGGGEEEREREMGLGHRCGICMRVFSSGQALGGHKRCHFEKGGLNCLDLNLPAPVEDYGDFNDSFSCFSSGLALDLRLGI